MSRSQVKKNIGNLVTSPSYLIFLFASAIVFFFSLVILQNISTLKSFSRSQGIIATFSLFGKLVLGFYQTTTPYHYISLIIISLLIGLVIALGLYRRDVYQASSKNTGILSTLGASIGIIAPSCAACSLGIIPLVGVTTGSFFALLPLGGLEISFISIFLLGFSTWKLASFDESCKLPKKR